MVGETAEIGDDVTLYQGVTLGGTGFATGKRHPTVQDNVTIGSGAKLLGPITVGHGAKIGANSVVITDVPPNSTVVGNPGHVVRVEGRKVEGPDADWIHLPDPVADAIKGLAARIEALERTVAEVAGRETDPWPRFAHSVPPRAAIRPAAEPSTHTGERMTETTTTTPDLLAEAQRLEALIDEHAAEGDERGRLSDPVVDALHDARIFGMWVPKELGGSELDPVSSLKVIDQLAYADPSTGWVTMAAGLAIGTGAAYLGDQAIEEIFGGERFPVIAGQGTRPGTAVPQDGGHLLSGSWQFASGIKHSGFIHTLGVVEGTGEPRIFVLPVEQATLIDNWDVMGLRATGSIDYEIDSVFVPEHFSHFAVTETPERGGDLYRLGIINIAGICHSGWALGIARRLMDELAKMVQAKAGRPGALADNQSFQEGFARAEGIRRAARALIFETWTDVGDTLARGEDLSVDQNTAIRLGTIHVTWAAHEVAKFVYASSGTTGLRSGKVQQLFRDMHAGTQHVIPSLPIQQTIGRKLAGLAPDTKWQFLELVDA